MLRPLEIVALDEDSEDDEKQEEAVDGPSEKSDDLSLTDEETEIAPSKDGKKFFSLHF
jgi:hypothetical protein